MKLHQSFAARTSSTPMNDRERQAWRSALINCHGVSALLVDIPEHLLSVVSSRPLNKHAVVTAIAGTERLASPRGSLTKPAALIDPYAWPFAAQSFDAVLLSWHLHTMKRQSRVLTEVDSCLAEDGRVLLHIPQANLAQWCRAGMAQAQALGWQLQEQYWGDARRVSLMPAKIAKQWAAPWQRYAPVAQWSVQLWQKNCFRLTPLQRENSLAKAAWPSAWPAQQRQIPIKQERSEPNSVSSAKTS